MEERFLLSFIIAFAVTINVASALPILYNNTPPSGTYWPGGLTNFSIYITEGALNISDVFMEIKAAEEKSNKWDRHYLGCVGINENTNFCSKLISLLIVGDDTLEVFYFNASDTFGNYGSLGNKTHSLNMTIDINPPIINPYNVANYSYVNSKKEVMFTIYDRSSGVNTSLSQSLYGNTTSKYGNGTWNSSYLPLTYANSFFSMKLNYSNLVNNGTYAVYVNATDNVGNTNESKILDLLIDNEVPEVNAFNPSNNELAYGTYGFLINAKDTLSGIDPTNVFFTDIKDQSVKANAKMNCIGSDKNMNCSYTVNTNNLGNGNHKLVFSVSDKAENQKNETVDFLIDNSFLQLSITSPADGSYANSSINIIATIANAENRVKNVKFRFDPSNNPWTDMTCNQSNICSYTWNSLSTPEGNYRLTVNVSGNFNYHLNKSVSVTLDRTLPQLFIVGPTNTTITGVAYAQLTIMDENLVNPNTIKFSVGNISSAMTCYQQLFGKLYNCAGSFNSYLLNNGTYTLIFEGSDYAWNRNTTQMEVLVANPPGTNEIFSNVTTNTTNATLNMTFPAFNLTTSTTTTTTQANIINVFDPGKQTVVKNEVKNVTIIQTIMSPLKSVVNSFKSSTISKVAGFTALVVIISGVILFVIGRKSIKPAPKIEILSIENIDSLFVEERSKLQFAYNYITSAFGMNERTTLRDYVKNAFGYLEKMDRTSFLKSGFEKSLDFMDKSINPELSQFIKENASQIYKDDKGNEMSRAKFIDDIKNILDEALGTDNINLAHTTIEKAKVKIEEFTRFSDREIEMWKKYMEKANALHKTTDKEEKQK